jgi:hypothetical protein
MAENAPSREAFEQTRTHVFTMFPHEFVTRKEAMMLSDAFDEVFEAMMTVYAQGATADDLLPLIDKYQGA